MANISVFLRPDEESSDGQERVWMSISGCNCRIEYQLIYRIKSDELTGTGGRLKVSRERGERGYYLRLVEEMLQAEIKTAKNIIYDIELREPCMSAEELQEIYARRHDELLMGKFVNGLIGNLKSQGKIRTSETYRSAMNSFRRFLLSRDKWLNGGYDMDIKIYHITSGLMREYENWLIDGGLAKNTISFYMRILRAVYNRAVEERMTEDTRPFKRVYTGIEKTMKRALTLRSVRSIKEVNLSEERELDYARDMFMLSFYLRGMSLVDMAFLKKKNLNGRYLTYRRSKTRQLLKIRWTKEMQNLLDKYDRNNSEYLLPIIRKDCVKATYVYRHVGRKINGALHILGRRLGIGINLTMYVARHSWASIAKTKGVPVSVISEGMGHDSEMTTKIYLAELDTSPIDRANRLILSALEK